MAARLFPTSALQSLIYIGVFLHQQQGVVMGMVTDFLYFATSTNSLEVLKKKKKEISPLYKHFFIAEFITAIYETHI